MKTSKETKLKVEMNEIISNARQFIIIMEDENVYNNLSFYEMAVIKNGIKKFSRLLKNRQKKLEEIVKNETIN